MATYDKFHMAFFLFWATSQWIYAVAVNYTQGEHSHTQMEIPVRYTWTNAVSYSTVHSMEKKHKQAYECARTHAHSQTDVKTCAHTHSQTQATSQVERNQKGFNMDFTL